jgi:hypothetical protein
MSKAETRTDRHIQYVLDKALALAECNPAPKRPKTLTRRECYWSDLTVKWVEMECTIDEETQDAWDEFDRPRGLDLG